VDILKWAEGGHPLRQSLANTAEILKFLRIKGLLILPGYTEGEHAVACRMPYAQLWRGSYRFRRRVPDHLGDVIGKRAWLEALGTSSKAEANRLVVPHIERTNQIIADAEAGNWPPVDDDRLSEIAEEWWQWFLKGLAKRLRSPAGQHYSMGLLSSGCFPLDEHALAGDAELTESVGRFIGERGLDVRPGSSAFARL
jgi:hypothetical protein